MLGMSMHLTQGEIWRRLNMRTTLFFVRFVLFWRTIITMESSVHPHTAGTA